LNTFRKIKKWVLSKTLQPYLVAKTQKTQHLIFKGIKLEIWPGVFHPTYFFSTKYLVDFIESVNLKNKTLLEIGCGSGLVSIMAHKQGALVTAIDISAKAVQNTLHNLQLNQIQIEVLESNLFQNLNNKKFDIIIINPPFYKKNPITESEFAWYCGENLQYFQSLFSNLNKHLNTDGSVYMILSDECAIEEIRQLCLENKLVWEQAKSYKNWLESNYIFKIKSAK
jgi:release factor glutamine methyltransferase